MKNSLRTVLLGVGLLGSGPVLAQVTNPIVTMWMQNTTSITGFNSLPANVQSVKYSNTSVYIAAKGIPSFTATFVADGTGGAGTSWAGQPTNGPVVVPQTQYRYRLPLTPTPNTGTPVTVPNGTVGVWINGTGIYSAKDAASYNTSTSTVTTPGSGVWYTDAVVNEGVGFDNCNGHPDISSYYHTHVNPDCLYDRRDSTRHSPIIGFALDGYPIYGAYGYKVATDPTSGIKSLKSSYRQRSITVRTHLSNDDGMGGTVLASSAGPAVTAGSVMTNNPLGKFVGDNEYIAGLGDLLANNGRWCVTPEYPNGTYAYFCTINSFYEGVFPYTVTGTYYGTVPYTPQGATSATISGAELAALQTYTLPTNLTVSTSKVLGGGAFANITVASGGNLLVTDPVTISGALQVQTGGAIDLGTLDPNSATASGTGTFSLAAGAKIKLDNPAGITSSGATGTVQVTGTRTYDSDAEYGYEGSSVAQSTGNGLPSSAKTVTINNSSSTGVTLTQSLTIPTAGTLTLTDGQVITASGSNLTVNGTLVAGTQQVTGGGNFTLASGATLKTAHTNGIRTSTPNGSIVATGTRTFSDGATYEFNGTTGQSTSAGLPATIAGLTINNASGVTLTNAVTVSSALNLTSGEFKTNGRVVTASTGATVTAGTNIITGTGTFTLNSGATLKTGNTAGLTSSGSTGTVQTTTRTFNTGASYEYNGAAAQATGTGLPATVANLTINNASGVTLTNDVITSTALTMTSGVLTTGTQKVTLGATNTTGTITETDASYVTGNVQTTRLLSTAALYNFANLGLKITPSTTGGASLPGSTVALRVTGTAPTGVNSSSGIKRYFTITPTTNTNLSVQMEFGYRDAELNGISESSLTFYKSTASATTGPWTSQHIGTTTRSATNNTVTMGGITGFSTWTLGSNDAPMPVSLTRFEAKREGTDAVLRWATASEKNNSHFEIEASTDGYTFEGIGQEAGHGDASQPHTYAFVDKALARYQVGTVYYRLRQVDYAGTSSYSPVRAVALEKGAATLALAAAPSPLSSSEQLRIYLTAPAEGTARLTLRDALGRVHYQQALPVAAGPGQLLLPLEATAALPAGVYSVQLTVGAAQVTSKLLKQ